MVLLISLLACGTLSFAAAAVLQFRLFGWKALCGLGFVPEERRALIDARRLSRRLSALMYAVSAAFFAGAFALHTHRVSPGTLSRVMIVSLLAAVDLSWFLYRASDRNEYSAAARASSKRTLLLYNAILLIVLLFIVS